MKLNIYITQHYSLIQSILERLEAVNENDSRKRIDEYTKCVYLDDEDRNRWEYISTNTPAIVNRWEIDSNRQEEVWINDVDVEAYLEAHRGKLAMTKLNLL